jgi:hypothetical protein
LNTTKRRAVEGAATVPDLLFDLSAIFRQTNQTNKDKGMTHLVSIWFAFKNMCITGQEKYTKQ